MILVSKQLWNPVGDDSRTSSSDIKCAIVFRGPNITLLPARGGGKDFAWVKIGSMVIYSCYFTLYCLLSEFEEYIELRDWTLYLKIGWYWGMSIRRATTITCVFTISSMAFEVLSRLRLGLEDGRSRSCTERSLTSWSVTLPSHLSTRRRIPTQLRTCWSETWPSCGTTTCDSESLSWQKTGTLVVRRYRGATERELRCKQTLPANWTQGRYVS